MLKPEFTGQFKKDYKTLDRAFGSVEMYRMIDEAYEIQERKARNRGKGQNR